MTLCLHILLCLPPFQMQSMAAEVEATGMVFGFVAAFVTGLDALLLMGLAAVFSALGLQTALWIATGAIAAHGLIELVFGPALVLKSKDDVEREQQAHTLDEQMNNGGGPYGTANDLKQPLI